MNTTRLIENQSLIKKVIIDNFLGFIKSKKYEFSDLFQTGFIGLMKADDKFNNKTKFSTFAYTCIKNEILTHLKKNKRYKKIKTVTDIKSHYKYFEDFEYEDSLNFLKRVLNEKELELINTSIITKRKINKLALSNIKRKIRNNL